MEDIVSWGRAALGIGLDAKEIGAAPMMLRAVVVYLVTILVARLGKKRFMGRTTAFDVILGIMLGSIASRAITGNAPFVPTLAATAALVGLHYLLSAATWRWHGFGTFLKGRSRILVRDGMIDRDELRRAHMSEHDLWEDLRGKGIDRLACVAEARLERSGQLSVLKAKPPPRIVEIAIEDGVKTVRLELG
ncbi:DUF421 domain-containing protein [Benzoatithermus flavus]|uniref:YetF domain-containing protein n=1 Tax=Benzoatithermus flavus TaxID=3108223 RepID=A0ABU8XZ52_9PROT